MRILTRYLLKSHVGPFLFAFFALSGILFVNTVARRFQDMAGKGLPISVVLEVFYLSMPHIIALTLPMAVLVAVLYAFAQLAADNEITAFKASGLNLTRLVVPLIFAGVLLTGFMVWFNDRVLPETNHQLKNLIIDLAATTPTLDLTEQVINPIRTADYRTRYWLKAARIDDQTQRMWDVVIYDLSNARKARTVYADSGRMAMNPARTDLMLTLYDGHLHEVDEAQQEELQRVAFREQRIELKGVGTELQRSQDDHRTDREMSVAMLLAVVDTARRDLAVLREEAAALHLTNIDNMLAGPSGDLPVSALMGPPSAGGRGLYDIQLGGRRALLEGSDEMAYRVALEARRLANNEQTLQDTINQYLVEYHKKYAIAFACIIFVLIGAPLAVRFPRGGVGMVIASSFTIFGIYYMSLIGGESLGDRGVIAPFWGPWAPNLLFGAIGVWALSRMGRETATSRGGDWEDLWATLRGMATAEPLRRRRAAARAARADAGADDARREARETGEAAAATADHAAPPDGDGTAGDGGRAHPASSTEVGV
jgi:lipopolysaccharide export system permease protein